MSRCFPWIFCPWSVFLLYVRWVPHFCQLFSWRAKAILGLDVQFLVPQMDCFFDSPIVEYLKMSHFPKSDVPFCCVLDLDAPSQLRRDPFRHWPTGFKGKQRFKGLRPAFFLLLGNLYGWTAKVEHHLHWHDLLIVPVCPCVHCLYPFVFLLDILYFFLDVFHVSHQGPTNRLVRCPWPRGRQRGEGEGKVQERSEGVWEPFRGKSFHGN